MCCVLLQRQDAPSLTATAPPPDSWAKTASAGALALLTKSVTAPKRAVEVVVVVVVVVVAAAAAAVVEVVVEVVEEEGEEVVVEVSLILTAVGFVFLV